MTKIRYSLEVDALLIRVSDALIAYAEDVILHYIKGKAHPMAMRALAFKWIRILWRCWQDRKPYDEAKYLLALKKNKSPLVQNLVV